MLNRLAEVLRVLRLESQGIADCAERLEAGPAAEQMDKALELLCAALASGHKIVVTGVGKSGKVAQKIVATLCSTGSHATYLHPTEGLHGDLGVVQPGDAVLALSQTGNTDELLQLVPSLKRLRVAVIAITATRRRLSDGTSCSSSSVLPVWLSARTASPGWTTPRSPCRPSVGWR